jgi:hypothetical protein
LRIAPRYGEGHIGHAPSCLGREAPNLAEIDHRKRAVLLDQKIAGMRVCVKDAALERGFQHETGDAARDRRSAAFGKVGNIRGLAPVDTLLREYTGFRVLCDDVGNFESVFAREHAAEKICVCRFATIVELCPQRVAELSEQAARVVLLKHWKTRGPLIEQACQNLQIDADEFVDPRLSHFEHHVAAIDKSGGVNLTNGSAPQRF